MFALDDAKWVVTPVQWSQSRRTPVFISTIDTTTIAADSARFPQLGMADKIPIQMPKIGADSPIPK
jgi:hypothetical protein